MLPVKASSSNEPLDFKISSFIVDDINYDSMPDLLMGIDVFSTTEGLNYTIIVKVTHDGKLNLLNHT